MDGARYLHGSCYFTLLQTIYQTQPLLRLNPIKTFKTKISFQPFILNQLYNQSLLVFHTYLFTISLYNIFWKR